MRQFVKEKNAFSLRFSGGLHDPNVLVLKILISFKLVDKYHIFRGENVGLWVEVVPLCFTLLSLPFEGFFVFFQIPDQKILSTELKVIAKMIDLLVRLKSFFVQLVYVVLFTPNNIPIIDFSFLVPLLLEGFVNAIGEVGFVLNDRARVMESGTKK